MKAGTATESREISKLELRAALLPESLDAKARTVDIVWTTGARVLRGGYDSYYEELSLASSDVRMGRLEDAAPLLDSHRSGDTRNVIGVVVSAHLTPTEGKATVRFAVGDAMSDAIWKKVQDGILRKVSVGYRVYKLEKIADAEDGIPVFRATDWEPVEISIVAVGADAGASVRSDENTNNLCEFIGLAEKEERMPEKNEEQSKDTKAPAPSPASIDLVAIRSKAAIDERARISSIRSVGKTLSLDVDMISRHISDGTESDKFRDLAIEKFGAEARKSPEPADGSALSIHVGEDVADKQLRGMSDWLITRAARAAVVSSYEKSQGKSGEIDGGEFRGMTLLAMATRCLETSGVSIRGLLPRDVVRLALSTRSASGSDFPVLLENAMHRILLAGYAETNDTWSQFCAVGSVNDFRAHNRYRLGGFKSLNTVLEGSEYKRSSLGDARREQISAATKGVIFGLTREAIINDDMGAFSTVPAQLGRAARRSIEDDVYKMLAENAGLGPVMADGNTLFHAAHANIAVGAALSVNGISSDNVLLGSQKDDGGNSYLDLLPNSLVLPLALKGDALVINGSEFDVDTAGKKSQVPNKVRNLLTAIVGSARLTGTRRYMFADPLVAPTIEVAFLDGQTEPYLEMRDGWNVDGVEWKVRLDYGVAAVDHKGAVTNAG